MQFESGNKIESKSLELSAEELKSNVKLGYFQKCKNREEHITIHPCWLNNIKGGISAELFASLGKWNPRLQGYVIGYEKSKLKSNIGAVNEDHAWVHVDITSTFFIYQPEIGHKLKGIIKKLGNSAAICTLFNVFTVTVFAADKDELSYWSVGDEIEFSMYSFINRRKGPILRARSIAAEINYCNQNPSEEYKEEGKSEDISEEVSKPWSEPYEEDEETFTKKKKRKRDKEVEEDEPTQSKRKKGKFDEEHTESSPKKVKKKKKKKDKNSDED